MGIFSSFKNRTSKYIDEVKQKKRDEELERDLYRTELRKQEERSLEYENRQRALNHQKEKAVNTLDSDAPLAHKIKAVNELYRENKPKKSNAMQELSDRMHMNRMKRDLRIEKAELIKQIVKEDKFRKREERDNRLSQVRQRNDFRKTQNNVKLMLRKR